MKLKEAILLASNKVGLNPYINPFKPSDLGLNSNQYGSFSDYCSEKDTVSGKHNKATILQVAERNRLGKPLKYLLIKEENYS